jgi:two-component system phosphate regulon sensor histidine kinase PhoR
MHKRSIGHIKSLIWALIALVLFGLLLGQLAWVLVLGLFTYLVWTIIQSVRLHRWLYSQQNKNQNDLSIPESYGLWGDLFEGIYQLQYQNKQNQDHLKSLINRVQMSTNALKDAVIMTDSEGVMEWWNVAASDLLGFRADTDRGQLISNLIRLPAFKRYFHGKDYHDPLEISSPINKNIKLRIYITLFGQDDRLVFVQDITRISRLEQMRKDFVSNVSHDLRTPLTVLKGYIETLQDAPDVPMKWHRPLKNMATQAQRMDTLIHDLLLLAKFETADLSQTTQQLDIVQLLRMVCHEAQLFSAERKHHIVLRIDHKEVGMPGSASGRESGDRIFIMGDERQLYSAFSNLVFNAVKYTPDQGEIILDWWKTRQGFHLSVKDTGVGFDPIHIPHLTERFYRTDPSRDNATGGSGLGLAIVKHVLLNHKGSLEIHSEEGVGSEFICHLPLSIDARQAVMKQG